MAHVRPAIAFWKNGGSGIRERCSFSSGRRRPPTWQGRGAETRPSNLGPALLLLFPLMDRPLTTPAPPRRSGESALEIVRATIFQSPRAENPSPMDRFLEPQRLQLRNVRSNRVPNVTNPQQLEMTLVPTGFPFHFLKSES